MGFLGAGLLAAAAAWCINRYLLGALGSKAIAKAIPAVEEILKTGSALLFNVSIPFTHGVFGAVEAVYEIQTSPKGLWPGLLAFINHLAFGAVTVLVLELGGGVAGGLAAAILVHTFWNWFVVSYLTKV